MRTHRITIQLILFAVWIFSATATPAQDPPKSTTQTQKIVEQGIAIEFTAESLVQNVKKH